MEDPVKDEIASQFDVSTILSQAESAKNTYGEKLITEGIFTKVAKDLARLREQVDSSNDAEAKNLITMQGICLNHAFSSIEEENHAEVTKGNVYKEGENLSEDQVVAYFNRTFATDGFAIRRNLDLMEDAVKSDGGDEDRLNWLRSISSLKLKVVKYT